MVMRSKTTKTVQEYIDAEAYLGPGISGLQIIVSRRCRVSAEAFPTHIHGGGAGFAASTARIGAAFTAFLFPVLLIKIGTSIILYFLVATSLLGAVVTWIFRIETTGMDLDKINQ